MSANYNNLIELLNKAKGERSLNQFAATCGIDAGHLSRLLRGIMINPPSPETLKKIAEKAHNGITYEALMHSAGHLHKKFIGANISLLKGMRSYEEYSEYLKEKGNAYISPRLLERYEKELEQPGQAVIDYLASAEKIEPQFFSKTTTRYHWS